MSPAEAQVRYKNELTPFEMQEMLQHEIIYTIGSHRVSKALDAFKNDGSYSVHMGEHFGYRYIVDKVCGEGAFGQVLMCRDMKYIGKIVAIKIGKNTKSETDNA